MSAKFKPQYRRLLFIDRRIRESAGMDNLPNCRTLAEEYETSTKTIQRDIEFLKYEMDAPIEYDEIRHGYYYTEDNYLLPAIRIAESDVFAICIAEKALKQYEGTPLYGRLESVFSKIQECLPERITVSPSVLERRMTFFPEAAPSIDPECWEASFKALQLGHTLEMEYQIPGKPAPYRNKVDPYHVVGHKGEWYIVGKCHYKGAIRMFGISRIKNAHVTTEAFQIPADFQFETMWKDHFGVMTSEHEYQVRIRFRRDQAPYVVEREWHAEQCFEQCGNGDVLMSFPTRHLFEVTRWVLGWGSAATVLQPPELQAAVKKQLSEAMENY